MARVDRWFSLLAGRRMRACFVRLADTGLAIFAALDRHLGNPVFICMVVNEYFVIFQRFGRRITAIICYTIVGISGFIVGVVQTVEVPNRDALTNGFALLAHIGITMAWGPVQTMTIELYPTVVRNIAFGTLSVMGRIGAMIGPQLVYLDSHVPGLLYYVCGAVSVVCVTGTSALPETMDADLNDKIGQMKVKSVRNNQIRNGVV
ncbi:organic cation/carnitine transporter 2-like [Mercenaria mercenaria]|uniref:organic cation/carnitine transporter 2-like n=1 Tax=Mercenaria mercenaria TaxID=6596 RepID=UPI00234F1E0B|nr:organic cation/carnitine transporter 2-like [Mercenaria mercenaria]